MSKIINRPTNHEHCVTKALELLQQSEGFLIITLQADQIRIGASISNREHDEMIAQGFVEFVTQRNLGIERINAIATNAVH